MSHIVRPVRRAALQTMSSAGKGTAVETVVVAIVVVLILLLPVRIGSWLLKAKRQGFWPSFLVLFFGAALSSVAGIVLPDAWLADDVIRTGIVFAIFTMLTMGILELSLLRGAVLALVICVVYSFSMTDGGRIGASFG